MMASDQSAQCTQVLARIRGEVNKVLIGQEELLERLLIALLHSTDIEGKFFSLSPNV